MPHFQHAVVQTRFTAYERFNFEGKSFTETPHVETQNED